MLRERGVVGKFVEFYGAGLANLPLADRATIGNMSPEFGSTCAIFPIDAETLRYLEFSGRPTEQIELVEAYAKEQGLWHDEHSEEPTFSDTIELDLADVVPSIAGPEAPAGPRLADRVEARVPDGAGRLPARRRATRTRRWPSRSRRATRSRPMSPTATATSRTAGPAARRSPSARTTQTPVTLADGTETELDHGHVVIAAITSCTNTSNPSVMLGAGILARNAVQKGLTGQAVGQDLAGAGLQGRDRVPGARGPDRVPRRARLQPRRLRLHDLHRQLRAAARGDLRRRQAEDLAVVSVLSGNRNFEGRINPDVKMNYLASPPLCVAYALAGTMDIDLYDEPLGTDTHGDARLPQGHLADEQPRSPRRSRRRSSRTCSARATARCSTATSAGTRSRSRPATAFAWDERSTYVRQPPFFDDMPAEPEPLKDIADARVLARPRRQRHHRPHLARRLDQARRPGRPVPDRARRRAARTSTPTARGAATTR